ncbi:MAG: ATP-binding protein [Rhodospirillales bacterium]
MAVSSTIKRYLPRSLLGRSLLIIVSPLILLQVVSALIFYESHWDKITRRLAVSVAGDISALMILWQEDRSPDRRREIIDLAAATMGLSLTFRPDDVLNSVDTRSTVSGDLDTTLYRVISSYVNRPIQLDSDSLEDHVVIEVQLSEGVMEVVVPRKRLSSSTTYVFIIWMVGSSLILFSVAMIFMRNQIRPIGRLAVAADNFGKGRNVESFKPEGATEVRQAAQAFLAMRERIQRQISQRTDMLAGVSHDLRTPITRIRLQLALLEGKEGVESLKADIDDMEYMLEEYLAFARGEGTERPEETKLSLLIEDAIERCRTEDAHIDLHIEEDISLVVRPNALKRAITNLVENATRYGDHVQVRAGRRGDHVEIAIDDDGPGVPADKREDVFKPFFRIEKSRNPGTGGVGLGLAIARDVVRGHGGDILLDDSPLGGLRASFRLPV